MSLQIYQRPQELMHPAYSHHTLFTVAESQSSIYTQNNFKFVFEVYILHANNLGVPQTEFHRFSVVPDEGGYAVFDAGQVIQDYCKTDVEMYAGAGSNSSYDGTNADYTAYERFPIHIVDAYSQQYSNLVRVSVAVYETFTNSSGTQQVQGYALLGDKYAFWNAVMPQDVGRDNFNDIFYNYNGSNDKFLTDIPSTVSRKVRRSDFHTFAFFNGKFETISGTSTTTDVHYLQFKFYNASGVAVGSTINLQNASSNGGESPSIVNIGVMNDITKMLLYAGVGPKNITNNGGTIHADTAYYTVQAVDSDQTTVRSALYTFELEDDDCKGFETIRLAYVNKHGAYDYYNFTKKSTRKVNTERGLLKKHHTEFIGASAFRDSFVGGTGVYKTKSVEIIEANTDYISEEEAEALESLFISPQVYIQELGHPSMLTHGSTSGDPDARFYPVIVTEKSYTKQTTANDGLKQYVIEIEKSNNIPIQRL